jgi:hypothetical protein
MKITHTASGSEDGNINSKEEAKQKLGKCLK